MATRVLVNGAFGRMGQCVVQAVQKETDLMLVGQTGHSDDLAAEIKRSHAEIVVDFTNADNVLKNIETIITAKARPIIGTSGLIKDQVARFQKRCAAIQLGGLIAPNFSLGAVLMIKYAAEMAKYFPQVEIIEMHHDGKLDSPSGTAVHTAEKLALSRTVTSQEKPSKETLPGARGAYYQNIHIHAIRLPGLVAHQQIIFGGIGETLTLRHDTIDRQCFMPGVILACKKVMNLKELVYGLEGIL